MPPPAFVAPAPFTPVPDAHTTQWMISSFHSDFNKLLQIVACTFVFAPQNRTPATPLGANQIQLHLR